MEDKFDVFAIVELLGKQRVAAKVSEQTIGGATFLRLDIPETERQPKFTRYISPTAIYAINPCTEAVCKEMANMLRSAPIDPYDLDKLEFKRKMLAQHPPKSISPIQEEEEDDNSAWADDEYEDNH